MKKNTNKASDQKSSSSSIKKRKGDSLQKIKNRIEKEEDFIYYPRLNNSLSEMLKKHPEGLSDDKIAKALLISEEEVDDLYESAISKIKKILKVK